MIRIYQEGSAMKRAKLFKNGQSQAVRLPKEFRFEGDEVFVQKTTADGVLLTPVCRDWERLKRSMEEHSPHFPARREQRGKDRREVLK